MWTRQFKRTGIVGLVLRSCVYLCHCLKMRALGCSRGDEAHSECKPHVRLDVLQLRPAQRLAHASGVLSAHAVPSALPQPPELQPVSGLSGL